MAVIFVSVQDLKGLVPDAPVIQPEMLFF